MMGVEAVAIEVALSRRMREWEAAEKARAAARQKRDDEQWARFEKMLARAAMLGQDPYVAVATRFTQVDEKIRQAEGRLTTRLDDVESRVVSLERSRVR